ncbi:MAG: hypothetical protein H6709_22855 [Kofleriaceae bacterium]|nr:hypothetical protein [Kofleriaceae bacterium]MCB9574923.1 hypothetical protein [Kofleriaceae bacterium]
MKLGEMLIADGRITEAQLQEALAQQARDGGRLGTVLVELEMIALDALTVYLGLELGIPIATGAMLERAKRAAVRLLSPEQAYRYKCVPLVIQDRQLIGAVEDPHDFETLDALARVTGYRVIPRVAPEIRIYYYVERYYGIPRPARFLVFGDEPRGAVAPVDDALPAPPLPGLPPVPVQPVNAPTPSPVLRRRRPTAGIAADAFDDVESRAGSMADGDGEPEVEITEGPPAPMESQEDLELDAEDLIIELEADDDDIAEEAPKADAAPSLGGHTERMPTVDYVAISADEAVAQMEAATERSDIAAAIMSFATGLFDVAALFIVRDHMAFGWKGTGAAGTDRVDCLLIPLDAPSVFQAALSRDDLLFHDAPAPSTVHQYLFKVLRCPQPARVSCAAITIGKRVVNMLYGHRSTRAELDDTEVDGLRRVSRAAAEAYVRLIAKRKSS